MTAETAAVLDGAADVIRRNGLYKGSFGANHGRDIGREQPCCAYGAINIASGAEQPRNTNDVGEAAYDALLRHLDLDDFPGAIADWNDEPDRTAEQVIAALEGAARTEREADQ